MAGKSNKRKKHSSSSSNSSSSCSSDTSADPGYTVNLSERLSRQNNFAPLSGYHSNQRKNVWEVQGFKCSPGTSTMRTKHKHPQKMNKKQRKMPMIRTSETAKVKNEPSYIDLESFEIGRKRSSITIRSTKSEDVIKKEGKIRLSRSKRSSENQGGQDDQGNRVTRNKNVENRKDKKKMKATIFSWLIDSKTVQENMEVFCVVDYKTQTIKEGILKRDGIFCSCCNKIFSASGFTCHSGRPSNKPYEIIFTVKNQVPLLSCMIDVWNIPKEFERRRFNGIETKGKASDSYDDACMICADGGNLMCCEECNSTYHQLCMDLEEVPQGSWYCPYCVCKFCGDPVCENDYLIECPQCEKRYHWECHRRRELNRIDINSIPCTPFCQRSCKEVHDKLEKIMVGRKNELDEGFSWTLLHRMDDDTGIYLDDTYQRTVCHSKLAVAQRLLEDCFEMIIDRHTRINVIQSVVYNCGANFNRIQFRGFYTAVLEKDEEIISAASLRIHGTKLAEMPFIATSSIHRCKGMCKKLMIAIESALCYLNVEYLVIPSVSERIGNWIEKYGFSLLETTLKKEIMCHNTLMFHDSVRLQKSLVASYLPKSGRNTIGGTSSQEARNNLPLNWLRFTNPATMASLFDFNLQPPDRNKNPRINNHTRLPYR